MIPRALFHPPVFLSFVTGCCVPFLFLPPNSLHPAPRWTSLLLADFIYVQVTASEKEVFVNCKKKTTEKNACSISTVQWQTRALNQASFDTLCRLMPVTLMAFFIFFFLGGEWVLFWCQDNLVGLNGLMQQLTGTCKWISDWKFHHITAGHLITDVYTYLLYLVALDWWSVHQLAWEVSDPLKVWSQLRWIFML